jgi:flagellar motor switch protein FliN
MENNKAAVRPFAAAVASAISESVSQAIGSPWPLEAVETSELPPRSAQPVQFRLKVEGGLHGECFIEFYEPHASELAKSLSGNEEQAGTEERDSTLSALISSATAEMATTLAARYGELAFKVDCVSGLAFGGMFMVHLSSAAEQAGGTLLLYFDAELLEALSPTPAVETKAEPGERPAPATHPANLKLVMDVELNVTLRFGQRQLPLREVLELGSGSVIELDRMVDEPVELLLDGKLVARGEAVIVDGNYGLRVTEIPQAIETHFLR